MIVVRNLFGLLLGLLAALVLWGLAEPYFIDEQVVQVSLPNLPPVWEGQRIGVIADLQVGMFMSNTGTIKRTVSRLIEVQPAAVLVAGDFIYHAADRQDTLVAQVVALLSPLTEAGIPTYAVLGNHDYAMPTAKATKNVELANDLMVALERSRVRVLRNEAESLTLAAGAEPLYIVGLGSHIAGEDAPEAALAGLPRDAARLIVMHHPETFKALPPESAPFAVAGHTHGGQFRLPFTPDWTWMAYTRDDEVHADGFIKDYGESGNRLYVNRGIGFSVVPLRLNCPPELTLLTLAGAEL